MDKAERHSGETEFPSGTEKARGSNNAHSGKAPDLSGTTLGPLETSFLRRKVASEYGNGKVAVELPIEEFMTPVEKIVKSRFITARAAARHMINQHSGVIIFVTGSPARPHVPGATAIGAAFAALENLTFNLAFEVSPLGVRVVCLRTVANIDSHSIQDTVDFLAARMNITRDQGMAQVAQQNFLKVPATVQDTANAAVLIASDRARMMTGTVVNASAGAALD